MKTKALLTALFGVVLVGCNLAGAPKKVVPPVVPKPAVVPAPVPPPPPPLSIPQTQIVLPKEQPLNQESLQTQPAAPPEPAPAAGPPPRTRTNRPPAPTAPATPPAAIAPTPEPREAVQEIVEPGELKRLQERAQARRSEAIQILDRIGRRSLSRGQQGLAASIRSFLALSEQAEKYNDMRQADALAERAQILAKELQSGK